MPFFARVALASVDPEQPVAGLGAPIPTRKPLADVDHRVVGRGLGRGEPTAPSPNLRSRPARTRAYSSVPCGTWTRRPSTRRPSIRTTTRSSRSTCCGQRFEHAAHAVEVAGDVGDAVVDAEPEGARASLPDELELEIVQLVEGLPVHGGEVDEKAGTERPAGEDADGAIGAG